jgi:hypothetical protein
MNNHISEWTDSRGHPEGLLGRTQEYYEKSQVQQAIAEIETECLPETTRCIFNYFKIFKQRTKK